MLASAAEVKHAMELTRAEIILALANSGYSDGNEIVDVQFKGFNGAGFVYNITYPSPDDEGTATGHIVVSLKRRAFSEKFDLYAEY